jgi:type I restriction enzyme, S subunit
MSLPSYSQYKESGVAWLGALPSTWQTRRAKHLFEIKKRIAGVDGYDVLSITQQGIKIKDIESNDGQLSMDYSKYQFVDVGDFAMNHMDLLTGYVDISKYFGVTSPDYRVFSIKSGEVSSPRYYLYLLQNGYKRKIFYAFGKGASHLGRWRFPTEEFNDFVFPLPPRDEQVAIANFLDHETSKIDALIDEQEKLLALLAEKRQATISHAVTRGLNAGARMADSGVMWLRDVPAHWVVCRLRRTLSRIEQGWSPECTNRPAEGAEWGVLKTGCVNGGIFNPCENKALPATLEPDADIEVRAGDLLMSRASGSPKLVGSVAFISDPPPRLMLSDKIFRLRLQSWVLPRFFASALNSRPLRQQIEVSIRGAEGLANNLPQSSLKDFWIAIPPQLEQEEIVTYLDTATSKLDALASKTKEAIGLLRERRSALISAAVTGKIDVRNTVPHELAA